MAESLLTGLVFTFHCACVSHNLVSGISELKRRKLIKRNFCLTNPAFPSSDAHAATLVIYNILIPVLLFYLLHASPWSYIVYVS